MAILVTNRVDLRARNSARGKEGYYIMLKESIKQDNRIQCHQLTRSKRHLSYIPSNNSRIHIQVYMEHSSRQTISWLIKQTTHVKELKSHKVFSSTLWNYTEINNRKPSTKYPSLNETS